MQISSQIMEVNLFICVLVDSKSKCCHVNSATNDFIVIIRYFNTCLRILHDNLILFGALYY